MALLCAKAGAQIVLDDFTAGTQAREGSATGTWIGQVTQNATTITVAGTAHDDNGWQASNLSSFDASAMHSITITGQLDTGNAAGAFNVQFTDVTLGSQAFSISTSAFLTGSMTTVSIPLGPWTTANPATLTGWSIGGGDFVTTGPAFRMTLDQLALSPSAIPEPAAYTALIGMLALGLALWRRRAGPA